MAEDEDSAGIGDALAAALGMTDPKASTELAQAVAQVREMYRARTEDAPLKVRPAVVLRRLHSIAKALQKSRRPQRRALDSPGVKRALGQAGVSVLARIGRRRKGARDIALDAIEAENLQQGLLFVNEAIKKVSGLSSAPRGREGAHLGRTRDNAKTAAVMELAGLYRIYTCEPPTRRGGGQLTRFERFLEVALGDLTRNTGRALARRWRRKTVEQDGGQNGVPHTSAAA